MTITLTTQLSAGDLGEFEVDICADVFKELDKFWVDNFGCTTHIFNGGREIILTALLIDDILDEFKQKLIAAYHDQTNV